MARPLTPQRAPAQRHVERVSSVLEGAGRRVVDLPDAAVAAGGVLRIETLVQRLGKESVASVAGRVGIRQAVGHAVLVAAQGIHRGRSVSGRRSIAGS